MEPLREMSEPTSEAPAFRLRHQSSVHPVSESVLKRFTVGTASRQERMAVVRHLLAGCPECRRHLKNCLL